MNAPLQEPLNLNLNLNLSVSEYAHLISLSSPSRVLKAAFGANGVVLRATPDNQWAIDALDALRRSHTHVDAKENDHVAS